jgi:type II secretory pathway component PulF
MKPMTAVLDPVMTIIAGVFVGFVAISVILSMNDLLGAIK